MHLETPREEIFQVITSKPTAKPILHPSLQPSIIPTISTSNEGANTSLHTVLYRLPHSEPIIPSNPYQAIHDSNAAVLLEHNHLPAGIKQQEPREKANYHILTCPYKDLVTFWKPPTEHDLKYKTPYMIANEHQATKYVTFEPGKQLHNNAQSQIFILS